MKICQIIIKTLSAHIAMLPRYLKLSATSCGEPACVQVPSSPLDTVSRPPTSSQEQHASVWKAHPKFSSLASLFSCCGVIYYSYGHVSPIDTFSVVGM